MSSARSEILQSCSRTWSSGAPLLHSSYCSSPTLTTCHSHQTWGLQDTCLPPGHSPHRDSHTGSPRWCTRGPEASRSPCPAPHTAHLPDVGRGTVVTHQEVLIVTLTTKLLCLIEAISPQNLDTGTGTSRSLRGSCSGQGRQYGI